MHIFGGVTSHRLMFTHKERFALWKRHVAEHPSPLSWETFKRVIVPGATPDEFLEIAARCADKLKGSWKNP